MSIYPMVDEFYINDGGSTDGTKEAIQKLEDTYPKIRMFNIPDFPSNKWECVDHSLMEMIKEANGEWIMEIQADEAFHEADHSQILSEIAYSQYFGFNGIRHRRYDVSNMQFNPDSYDYRVVRILKNVDGLVSLWGGDDWRVPEADRPRTRHGPNYPKSYTSSCMEPEYDSDVRYYHMINTFKDDGLLRAERHANYLAIGHGPRVEAYNLHLEGYRVGGSSNRNIRRPVSPNLPKLIRSIKNRETYEVREELFDPEWMTELTGVDYT